MSYKIKTLDLRKEGRNVDKMLQSRYLRPLKYLSYCIYREILSAEMSITDWRWIGFDSKGEWEHDCRVAARSKHKDIMNRINTEMDNMKNYCRFNIMNRLIQDHYEKESLKSSLYNEKKYSEHLSKICYK